MGGLLLTQDMPGADAGDPETWRAASPHWTDARGKMIASKYKAALDDAQRARLGTVLYTSDLRRLAYRAVRRPESSE